MRTIIETLDALDLGPATEIGRLAVVPLRAQTQRTPDYVTLDQAFRSGHLRIREVSRAGHVSELSVTNDGNTPVLFLQGEELRGAKQNRIINVTILMAENSRLTIPVSCVEAGRWAYTRPDFIPAGRVHYGSGRAMACEQVTGSLRVTGARTTDQFAIWQHIADKSARLGIHSESGASDALFAAKRDELDAYGAGIRPGACDVGALFLIDGQPAGLELCDAPATWGTLLPKLLDSYGLDVFDRGRVSNQVLKSARDVIKELHNVTFDRFAGFGLGDDIRFDTPDICGSALEWRDRIIHLSAFVRPRSAITQRVPGSSRPFGLFDRLVWWIRRDTTSGSRRPCARCA